VERHVDMTTVSVECVLCRMCFLQNAVIECTLHHTRASTLHHTRNSTTDWRERIPGLTAFAHNGDRGRVRRVARAGSFPALGGCLPRPGPFKDCPRARNQNHQHVLLFLPPRRRRRCTRRASGWAARLHHRHVRVPRPNPAGSSSSSRALSRRGCCARAGARLAHAESEAERAAAGG
jgi:hypothetical protein